MRLHWFGQSSFALTAADGTSVMLDPYFPLWRPAAEFIHTRSPLDETTFPVDGVLVTHDHRDHNCPESLHRLSLANPGVQVYGPDEAHQRWTTCVARPQRIHRVQAGDSFSIGSVLVHAVWAKPPMGDDRNGIPAPDVVHLGYVIEADKHCIWFSGDLIRTFAASDALIGAVRRHSPTIGVITTHPVEGEFPLFADVWNIARKLNLKQIVPAHYDCFIKRTYDPLLLAEAAGRKDKQIGITLIPYNSMVSIP